MASAFPRSPASVEIRQLVVHTYSGRIKAADAERLTVLHGRSGVALGWGACRWPMAPPTPRPNFLELGTFPRRRLLLARQVCPGLEQRLCVTLELLLAQLLGWFA